MWRAALQKAAPVRPKARQEGYGEPGGRRGEFARAGGGNRARICEPIPPPLQRALGASRRAVLTLSGRWTPVDRRRPLTGALYASWGHIQDPPKLPFHTILDLASIFRPIQESKVRTPDPHSPAALIASFDVFATHKPS